MEHANDTNLQSTCLVFPFSKINANAISALIASIDTDDELKQLNIFLPGLKDTASAIISKLGNFKRIVLAFSLFSTQLDEISAKIEEYRKVLHNYELLVISGGPHPMGDPYSSLINGSDIVCTTEGELVIRSLIKQFANARDVREVPGIAFLNGNKVVKTQKPPLINLDDFPPFSVKYGLIRPIEITRGCAWNCRFCQIRSRGIPVRHRSVNQVLKFVEHTVNHFHKRRPDIRFISPNALSYGSIDGKTINLNVVEQLLDGIKKIIGPSGKIYFGSFPSEVRPETITPESAKLLKKYTNVEKLIVGGQSGSDKILQISDRGHTAQETERAVKLLIDTGFEVDVDIIFGLPGETQIEIQETLEHIDVLTKLGATIHSHTFMPLVGTPFASKAAGEVHEFYLPVINHLQRQRKLSGFHAKQQKQAKAMEERRIKEKNQKKN